MAAMGGGNSDSNGCCLDGMAAMMAAMAAAMAAGTVTSNGISPFCKIVEILSNMYMVYANKNVYKMSNYNMVS